MNISGIQLLQNIQTFILDPVIILIFTAGFLVFIWGLVQFMWHLKDGGGHDEGVQHMFWGIIGMFIMVAVGGIIALIQDFVGVGGTVDTKDINRINSVQVPNIFNKSN